MSGVTSALPKRAYEHREGLARGFTKEHGLKLLVYYEWHDTIQAAIQREKNIKHWPRAWKVRLIHGMNPDWDDLYDADLRRSVDSLNSSCPASVPGIHVFLSGNSGKVSRGWPGRARP
jgi:putative endonuclease